MTPKDILKLTDLYGEIFWLGIFHILKKNWNLAKLMATEIEKNTWFLINNLSSILLSLKLIEYY